MREGPSYSEGGTATKSKQTETVLPLAASKKKVTEYLLQQNTNINDNSLKSEFIVERSY